SVVVCSLIAFDVRRQWCHTDSCQFVCKRPFACEFDVPDLCSGFVDDFSCEPRSEFDGVRRLQTTTWPNECFPRIVRELANKKNFDPAARRTPLTDQARRYYTSIIKDHNIIR